MKKILACLLVLAMLLGLCACGAKPDVSTPAPSDDVTTTTTTEGADNTDTTADGTDTTADISADTTADISTDITGTTASSAQGTTGTTGRTTTTTRRPTTKTSSTIVPTTKPTTKPTQSADGGMAIRVLAIGDHYAVDAMDKYLYDLLKSAGYDTVHLGILYTEKGTLDTHYDAVKNDTKTYEFRQNKSGKWE